MKLITFNGICEKFGSDSLKMAKKEQDGNESCWRSEWMNEWTESVERMNEWMRISEERTHANLMYSMINVCRSSALPHSAGITTSSCSSDLWCLMMLKRWNVYAIVYFWDVVVINFMNLCNAIRRFRVLCTPSHTACLLLRCCITFFAWIIHFFRFFANKEKTKWKSVDVHKQTTTTEEAKKSKRCDRVKMASATKKIKIK